MADAWESDTLNEVWDPDPLQVGDRVRLRLSEECGWHPTDWHGPDGGTGTIDRCEKTRGLHSHYHETGHVYCVRLDQPYELFHDWSTPSLRNCLTRTELERA